MSYDQFVSCEVGVRRDTAGMDGFVRAVADGISGLVGGSIAAIGAAFGTIVGQLQVWLPGPLLPIAVFAVGGVVGWWFLRR